MRCFIAAITFLPLKISQKRNSLWTRFLAWPRTLLRNGSSIRSIFPIHLMGSLSKIKCLQVQAAGHTCKLNCEEENQSAVFCKIGRFDNLEFRCYHQQCKQAGTKLKQLNLCCQKHPDVRINAVLFFLLKLFSSHIYWIEIITLQTDWTHSRHFKFSAVLTEAHPAWWVSQQVEHQSTIPLFDARRSFLKIYQL